MKRWQSDHTLITCQACCKSEKWNRKPGQACGNVEHPPLITPVDALSGTCWSQGKQLSWLGGTATIPSQVACVFEALTDWGTWNTIQLWQWYYLSTCHDIIHIYYGFVFKSSPICQTCINKKSRASRCRYLCVVMKRQGTDGNCNLEVVWTAPGLCDKISAMSIKLTLTSSTTHTWGHTDINRFVLNYVQHGWKTCYECKMCMVQMCGWPQ